MIGPALLLSLIFYSIFCLFFFLQNRKTGGQTTGANSRQTPKGVVSHGDKRRLRGRRETPSRHLAKACYCGQVCIARR
ncbi:GL22383 [Drosophila persimilis]|uniref:GL22383 n=1 Tax=Drosophila persimilis TaxID=7234 RepID=B4IS58_DROPE|nr:GL22383 [Drosophila persimilis]